VSDQTLTKVAKYEILKPEKWVGGDRDGEACTWKELGKLLRDVQYIESRIANLMLSEKYVAFRMRTTETDVDFTARKASKINEQIRHDLVAAGSSTEEEMSRFSLKGALASYVLDALTQCIISPQTSGQNWSEVCKSNASLPSYKRNLPVCIRCDKPRHKKVFVDDDGDHKLDLGLTLGSKCRIVLRTGGIDGSQKTILDRLTTPDSGWTQQTLQISFNERRKKWFLSVVFRFPAEDRKLDPDVIVGADLGYSCPLFAAVSNSEHARIGRREFGPITEQVRRLQSQTIARRNQILRGGKDSYVKDTSRGGHGRKRRMKPIERLQAKIDNAYKSLNHQISRRLIDFALQQNAGTIQIEDLGGMHETLTGTFLGQRWRYHELQQFIEYKAKEVGIAVKTVDPQYTSRRCSKCGHIHVEFTREYRDKNKPLDGGVCKFECPACGLTDLDPDYNAAKNLTVKDIAKIIKRQCKKQDLSVKELELVSQEAEAIERHTCGAGR
jgi:IS605 OrfB family transposase